MIVRSRSVSVGPSGLSPPPSSAVSRTLEAVTATDLAKRFLEVVICPDATPEALEILARRKDADYELPFGTFLGAGALLVVFFGTPLVNWYQSLLTVR